MTHSAFCAPHTQLLMYPPTGLPYVDSRRHTHFKSHSQLDLRLPRGAQRSASGAITAVPSGLSHTPGTAEGSALDTGLEGMYPFLVLRGAVMPPSGCATVLFRDTQELINEAAAAAALRTPRYTCLCSPPPLLSAASLLRWRVRRLTAGAILQGIVSR